VGALEGVRPRGKGASGLLERFSGKGGAHLVGEISPQNFRK
jgi:hypothetical protein